MSQRDGAFEGLSERTPTVWPKSAPHHDQTGEARVRLERETERKPAFGANVIEAEIQAGQGGVRRECLPQSFPALPPKAVPLHVERGQRGVRLECRCHHLGALGADCSRARLRVHGAPNLIRCPQKVP